ncbi:MAG TPA: glycosyltransferase [Candidatus Mediterraneibacter merdigallinarum]|nr:glycosyltransferase [Candidatus Mediterraneibacter merdigallinarum]
MDLISVIVPIYNVEQYLNQCLQSICSQSYKNLEIILVDDGSSDRCPELCDVWAEKDSRIRVIHKQNGGLSDARNAGMVCAKGEYIAFVDSDDWIEKDLYQKLWSELHQNNAQIAACGIVKVFETTSEEQKIYSKQKIFTNEEALQTLLKGQDFCAVAWNKLYKRDVIEDIRFPVGRLHEDEFFTYRVIANASKLVLVPEAKYYYRQRAGSIMDKWTIRHLDSLDAFNERMHFLQAHYPDLYDMDKFNFYLACVYNGRELATRAEDDMTTEQGITKVLKYSRMISFSIGDFVKLGFKKAIFIVRGRILFWRLSRLKN